MINLGFWGEIKKPIFCLAPMADVTDCAFRQIIAKYGKPDVFWTEFVSADGLCSAGREKLLVDFIYSENERPMVAQIFGSKPENIKKASELCRELGFDGVDINMGCPDKSIEKQCAGAAMMKNPQLAREIIRAAKEGAGDLPVSVKTRIGYNKNEIETWIRELLSEDIAALTVHLRTRKEMSNVPAHWDLMKRIVQIRNEMKKKTLILGNGDVLNLEDAKRKVEETGCDGVMLGKAIFGNPWLFAEKVPSIKEKLEVMIEHTKLFEKMLGGHKNFAIMKKHYKAYVNGFDGAKELRVKLMEAENALQVENIANDFLGKIE
ncbi:MAG: tRNA-dihydrouridine synthase [Candidatus Nomurabacteria bacterium GW2011_GWA1_40_8]|nr:MAG: tRNA-dihydrouridine synthase [Candidatus Nomurabacteria bacterium GW2011_GWA1_40_8]